MLSELLGVIQLAEYIINTKERIERKKRSRDSSAYGKLEAQKAQLPLRFSVFRWADTIDIFSHALTRNVDWNEHLSKAPHIYDGIYDVVLFSHDHHKKMV